MGRLGALLVGVCIGVVVLIGVVSACMYITQDTAPATKKEKTNGPLGWGWDWDDDGHEGGGGGTPGVVDTEIATNDVTEGELERDGTATFNFSSPGNAGATFQCRLDEGTNGTTHFDAWESCTSPKAYTGLENRPHNFEVRATNAGDTDATPATLSWRSWACDAADDANTENITPGEDLEAAVEGDASGTSTEFCVHAGTYEIAYGGSDTDILNIQSGDTIEAEPGTMRTHTMPDGYVIAHADDAVVEITDDDGSAPPDTQAEFATDATTGMREIIRINGVAGVTWVECYGARAITDANGNDLNGTGLCIKAGQATAAAPPIAWNELHDNGAKGAGQPKSGDEAFTNNHCYRNTHNPSFKGWDGSCIKGGDEFEARDNYVHNEQGNGIWCDVNIQEVASTGTKGCWFHRNMTLNLGRYGFRYENTPTVSATRPRTYHYCEGTTTANLCDPANEPNQIIEKNIIAQTAQEGSGFGGAACHDSQNCMVRENWLQPVTVYGSSYATNGPPGCTSGQCKAIQLTDSGNRIETWNNDAYGNIISPPQHIQGATSQPNSDVYANNNSSLGSITGDESADTFQNNNNYGYTVLP